MTNVNQMQNLAIQSYDYAVAKKNLAEKIEARLNVIHNNGFFIVNENLISFLHCWQEDELVLLDSYKNPIRVNRQELLNLAKQRYHELLNEWAEEWQQIKKIRNIQNV